MKKEIDKLRIKNWTVGDTFAWQINSQKYPFYNGRYVLLTMIEAPATWDLKRNRRALISKLTTDYVLPKTQEEYDKLDTIKIGTEDPVEIANRLYKVIYSATPDDYGYIYDYAFELCIPSYKISNSMKYIGNFIYVQPRDSYMPNKRYYGLLLFLYNEDFDLTADRILSAYEDNNLKNAKFFTKEYLENREKIREDYKAFMNNLRVMFTKIIKDREKEKSFSDLTDDEFERSSKNGY